MTLRQKISLALLGALVAVLAGCGSGAADKPLAATAPKGDAAKGKEAFNNSCISCHGADAKGLTGLGKNLVSPSDWMKKQSDTALVEFIKKGRSASDPENTAKVDMPPKGGNPALSDEDVINVVAYIRTLQK